MVVHGGLAQGDTWLFDLEARAWRSISHESGASPGVRHGATFTPLPHFHPYPRGSVGAGGGNHGGGVYGGSAVFVGGADMEQGTLCNDVWLFSMQRGWTLLQQHHNELRVNTPIVLPNGVCVCVCVCVCVVFTCF